MNEFHLVAQAKGGIGKSLVASLVGQYKRDYKQAPAVCVDIDPLNNTFAQFKSLDVGFVDVTEGGKAIIPGKFDTFINAAAESEADFVVDSGASVFISLMNYLTQDSIIRALAEDLNKKVFIHTILVGGQAKKFTLDGLGTLLHDVPNHPNVKIVVWINEFFGPLEIDGHPVQKLKIIKEAQDRIAGFITLRCKESDVFNVEFKNYCEQHKTLADVKEGKPQFAAKLRLETFTKDIFSQIDAAIIGQEAEALCE